MKKGLIALNAGLLMWAALALFWKLLAELSSFYVLANRIVWSMVFALLYIAVFKKWDVLKSAIKDKRVLGISVLSGFAIALNWGIYVYAIMRGFIVQSSLGYYINPLFSVIIGVVLFKEKISKRGIFAILLAAAAVVYLTVMMGEIPHIAFLIVLSFGGYGVLKKLSGLDSMVGLFVETASVALFAIIYIVYAETHGVGAIGVFSGWQWALLPLSGVVTAVPLALFGYGLQHTPYSLAGILQYLNPTIQLLLGVLLLGEEFHYYHAISFILIWLAQVIFLKDSYNSTNSLIDTDK